MADLHAFGQSSLKEAGHNGNYLPPPLLCSIPLGSSLFEVAAHFADDDDCLRLWIVLEHFEITDVVGSRIGIASDSDGRGNTVGKLRTDPNNLVGETA